MQLAPRIGQQLEGRTTEKIRGRGVCSRLRPRTGNPITDPAAVRLTSVPLSCAALTKGTDAVEEYAAGSSGLQNLGGGAYQINWGTAKTFAGSCRGLLLDLGEQNPNGTPFYRTADFRFTK